MTFGVFQEYYQDILLTDHSSSTIAWISTVCAFILLAGGVVTGPLYDYGLYFPMIMVGTILQSFGVMMISLSTKYYQLFLSQGVCVGVGAALTFTPSVAAAASSFQNPTTRAKMMGLMSCFSSLGKYSSRRNSNHLLTFKLGGVVYPIMFRYLVPQIGFPWAVRAIGFVIFGLYCVSYLNFIVDGVVKKGPAVRRMFDTSAFTDLPYVALWLGGLLTSMAYYIPLLYIPVLAEFKIPQIGSSVGFDLVAILNGASLVGRLLAGFAGARYGSLETFTVGIAIGAVMLFCWIALNSLPGYIVWAIFWGIPSGTIVALPGAFVPLFSPSLALIGTRSGMYWASIGLGILVGSPIAGALFELDAKRPDTTWWRLQVFAGCVMLASVFVTILPLMHLHKRRKVSAKN